MKTDAKSLHNIDQEYHLQTYRRYPLVLATAKGCRVWDTEGNEYLDALAGIAVNNVGHCHPKVVEALRQQAGKLMHISNFYLSEPLARLCERLAKLSGMDRVFLSNSGAEAVEGAFKIARKYAHKQGKGGGIVYMDNAFHGRTLATLAAGKEAYQQGFEPIPSGFHKVPFNDVAALEKMLNKEIAAVILEPVQGEGGINVADRHFLQEVSALCQSRDILFILDEVQCGIARTGEMFAKDHFGIQPDLLCLAKGLGGGVPIGAVLAMQKAADAITYGDHGSTFGGNPLVCAAALANLDVIEEEDLVLEAIRKGKYLKKALYDLKHPLIEKVRGLGLMLGVVLHTKAAPVVQEMLRLGVLANATAGNILRLVPPLVISYEEIDQLVNVTHTALNNIQNA
jgi:acetylornithine/N-succinyldiaminopimelate aminotransferase